MERVGWCYSSAFSVTPSRASFIRQAHDKIDRLMTRRALVVTLRAWGYALRAWGFRLRLRLGASLCELGASLCELGATLSASTPQDGLTGRLRNPVLN